MSGLRERRDNQDQPPMSYEDFMSSFWFMTDYDPQEGFAYNDDDTDLTEEEQTNLLRVLKVDLCIKANTTAHHTDEFDITDPEVYNDTQMLVVRRGQDFDMKIQFNKPYDYTIDDLRLVFDFGNCPIPSKGSRVELLLSDKDYPNEWGAFIKKSDGQWLTLTITTPPTCAVAKWNLKIDVVKQKDDKMKVKRYTNTKILYIFYLIRGAKFRECVLPCVMELLDNKSSVKDSSRGDAVKVARQLSSLVNGCDNYGILQGNWSGDYVGGTSPGTWKSSVSIISEYYKNKETVKYGQCWVFSGVLTTVCRAIGIPTRSVTNFASAQDTDCSCTIDTHYNSDFKAMKELSGDSVWNFHVWNEIWMCRRDVPTEFRGSGWQIIDATPKEESGGVYCMGPFPIEAIKVGAIHFNYDGRFAFSEVNADRWKWYTDNRGKTALFSIEKDSVGKCISTKRPLSSGREDITHLYKYEEGSTEERMAVLRANLHTKKHDMYENIEGDVKFDMVYDDETFIGSPIKFDLKIKNTNSNARTIRASMKIVSTNYTGATHMDVRGQDFDNIILKGNEEKCVSLVLLEKEYLEKLEDTLSFKMMCIGRVCETEQIFSEAEPRRLRKPHLTLSAPKVGIVDKKFVTEVSFVNPLYVALTECELKVDGPGIQDTVTLKQKGEVGPHKMFTTKLDFTPMKGGDKDINVSFNSRELSDVNVSTEITISKKRRI